MNMCIRFILQMFVQPSCCCSVFPAISVFVVFYVIGSSGPATLRTLDDAAE